MSGGTHASAQTNRGQRLGSIRRAEISSLIDPAIALLCLSLPLSVSVVVDWRLAAPKLTGLIIGITTTLALSRLADTPKRLCTFVFILGSAVGLAIGLIGLFGASWQREKYPIFQTVYQRLPSFFPNDRSPADGIFLHPNEISGALTLIIPIAVALAGHFRVTNRRLFWALISCLAIMLTFLLLAVSRGAWNGIAVALTVYVVAEIWRTRQCPTVRDWRAIGAMSPVVGLTCTLVLMTWYGWDSELQAREAVNSRAELLLIGLEMVRDTPYTGIGIGQFPRVMPALYPSILNPADAYTVHAHNLLVQFAIDLGLPGAAAIYCLIAISLLASGYSYVRGTDPLLRACSAGLFLGLLAYLVYGLTDAIGIGSKGGMVLWISLGLGAATSRLRPNSNSRYPTGSQS